MMKVGIGITTYQRFDRFKECFENLLKNSRDIDEIIVVNDFSIIDKEKYENYFSLPHPNYVKFFTNEKNLGVGVSKNRILKYFYDKDYDYIFTLEDDINIKSPDFVNEYINACQKTGIEYWNFAVHGTHNATYKVSVVNDYVFKVYPNIVGALSLHTRKLIDIIGYYDEDYFNAMEHVDYYYKAQRVGLATPFWSFADILKNESIAVEQKNSIAESSIRPRDDWQDNIQKGLRLFREKNGVGINDIPRP